MPIIEHMETIGITDNKRPSVMYLLQSSNCKAHNACDKLNSNVSLQRDG